MASSRQWLQKQFQSTGIQIDSAALKKLAAIIESDTDPLHLIHRLLDKVETGNFLYVHLFPLFFSSFAFLLDFPLFGVDRSHRELQSSVTCLFLMISMRRTQK